METFFGKIGNEVKKFFKKDPTGHDFYHIKRTFDLAINLQKKEGGDKLVIGAAALLHDIHRYRERNAKKLLDVKGSLDGVRKILEKTKFPKDKISAVLHCIKHHEAYSFTKGGKKGETKEALILQDADNLDAMGAIGIARCFTFGGAHKVPLWIPEKETKERYYKPYQLATSSIHHFYDKLLKLKDNMNTKTARKIAEKRHKYMKEFLDRFFKEWGGKL